jgi:hypothetical protein
MHSSGPAQEAATLLSDMLRSTRTAKVWLLAYVVD